MGKNAAFHGFVNYRRLSIFLAALAAGAVLIASIGGSASAKRPIGKDGTIHACYRVKGKPKGALRVVPSARTRCRRGERKTAWSVSPPVTSTTAGSAGSQGPSGAAGSAGADEAALKAQVGALSLRVEALEGILQGITNGDLTGMLGVLQGVTNEDLLAAVGAVPAVESLCEQSEALTEQVDDLGAATGALVSILNGTILGPIFGSVSVPAVLGSFNCPTS